MSSAGPDNRCQLSMTRAWSCAALPGSSTIQPLASWASIQLVSQCIAKSSGVIPVPWESSRMRWPKDQGPPSVPAPVQASNVRPGSSTTPGWTTMSDLVSSIGTGGAGGGKKSRTGMSKRRRKRNLASGSKTGPGIRKKGVVAMSMPASRAASSGSRALANFAARSAPGGSKAPGICFLSASSPSFAGTTSRGPRRRNRLSGVARALCDAFISGRSTFHAAAVSIRKPAVKTPSPFLLSGASPLSLNRTVSRSRVKVIFSRRVFPETAISPTTAFAAGVRNTRISATWSASSSIVVDADAGGRFALKAGPRSFRKVVPSMPKYWLDLPHCSTFASCAEANPGMAKSAATMTALILPAWMALDTVGSGSVGDCRRTTVSEASPACA